MKRLILITFLGLMAQIGAAQEKFNLYNPGSDAKKELENAVSTAKAENKHVFIQIGGNWCGWCKLFHEMTSSDEEIKAYLAANYVPLHINYSKENQNLEMMELLEYPQRFGFPVFVILDSNGKRIHTQSSGYLEEGKGYNKKLVMEFLQNWSLGALNPDLYKKK